MRALVVAASLLLSLLVVAVPAEARPCDLRGPYETIVPYDTDCCAEYGVDGRCELDCAVWVYEQIGWTCLNPPVRLS